MSWGLKWELKSDEFDWEQLKDVWRIEQTETPEDDWPHKFSFNEIAELIVDARQDGHWAISRSGILPSPVAKRLRKMGYEVYVNGDTSDPYFSINWYNVEKGVI